MDIHLNFLFNNSIRLWKNISLEFTPQFSWVFNTSGINDGIYDILFGFLFSHKLITEKMQNIFTLIAEYSSFIKYT